LAILLALASAIICQFVTFPPNQRERTEIFGESPDAEGMFEVSAASNSFDFPGAPPTILFTKFDKPAEGRHIAFKACSLAPRGNAGRGYPARSSSYV
jgi:hypothetical protein